MREEIFDLELKPCILVAVDAPDSHNICESGQCGGYQVARAVIRAMRQ